MPTLDPNFINYQGQIGTGAAQVLQSPDFGALLGKSIDKLQPEYGAVNVPSGGWYQDQPLINQKVNAIKNYIVSNRVKNGVDPTNPNSGQAYLDLQQAMGQAQTAIAKSNEHSKQYNMILADMARPGADTKYDPQDRQRLEDWKNTPLDQRPDVPEMKGMKPAFDMAKAIKNYESEIKAPDKVETVPALNNATGEIQSKQTTSYSPERQVGYGAAFNSDPNVRAQAQQDFLRDNPTPEQQAQWQMIADHTKQEQDKKLWAKYPSLQGKPLTNYTALDAYSAAKYLNPYFNEGTEWKAHNAAVGQTGANKPDAIPEQQGTIAITQPAKINTEPIDAEGNVTGGLTGAPEPKQVPYDKAYKFDLLKDVNVKATSTYNTDTGESDATPTKLLKGDIAGAYKINGKPYVLMSVNEGNEGETTTTKNPDGSTTEHTGNKVQSTQLIPYADARSILKSRLKPAAFEAIDKEFNTTSSSTSKQVSLKQLKSKYDFGSMNDSQIKEFYGHKGYKVTD